MRGGGRENQRREGLLHWRDERANVGIEGCLGGPPQNGQQGFLCKINGDHKFLLHVEINFNSWG